MDKVRIVGFAGSLRKESYNKALLKAALSVLPADAELEILELDGIPLYSQDMENDPPETLKIFKSKIKKADALLIATPEYNYSIPGVLKNAIDAASRPYGASAFEGKPTAIMGASVGTLGTARAQYHLRQCCVFLNMHPLNQPEVMVANVQDKVDANGVFTDQDTISRVGELLEALVKWTRKLK